MEGERRERGRGGRGNDQLTMVPPTTEHSWCTTKVTNDKNHFNPLLPNWLLLFCGPFEVEMQ